MKTMKKILMMAACLLVTIVAKAGQPEISLTQLLQLERTHKPQVVLKKVNVRKLYLQVETSEQPFQCLYGRNVAWSAPFAGMKMLSHDALGVCYVDAGSGGWMLLTDHKEWLPYYLKEARKLGFYPSDSGYPADGNGNVVPHKQRQVKWWDVTDENDKVIGRSTELTVYYKDGSEHSFIIYDYADHLQITLGWAF